MKSINFKFYLTVKRSIELIARAFAVLGLIATLGMGGLFVGWVLIIAIPTTLVVAGPAFLLFMVYLIYKKANLSARFHSTIEAAKQVGQFVSRKLGHPVVVCLCVVNSGATSRVTVQLDDGGSGWSHSIDSPNEELSAAKMKAFLEGENRPQILCAKSDCVSYDVCPKRRNSKNSAEAIFSETATQSDFKV